MDQANVVFFGSGSLGVPCLQELARRGFIDVVVSQPDRPAGRGRVSTPTPISVAALEYGLKLIRTDNANQLETLDQCARQGARGDRVWTKVAARIDRGSRGHKFASIGAAQVAWSRADSAGHDGGRAADYGVRHGGGGAYGRRRDLCQA